MWVILVPPHYTILYIPNIILGVSKYMPNNSCFHVYVKSLIGNVYFFDIHSIILPCEFRGHGAGSQLKIALC